MHQLVARSAGLTTRTQKAPVQGSADWLISTRATTRAHNRGVCGRYAAARDAVEIADWFEAEQLPADELPARYNIAPTQESYIVIDEAGVRAVEIARWGLVPSWSTDATRAARMINARSETVAEKPAYRSAFRRRRCLVPVDGYYEWQAVTSGSAAGTSRVRKQPFYIHEANHELLALAGLFEDWTGPQGSVRTFTILTQDSRAPLDRIHDRMPVVVDPEHWGVWLDPHAPVAEVSELVNELVEGRETHLQAYPVSMAVNKSSNEGPQMRAPVGPRLPVG